MKYYQIASPATEKSLVTGRINPSGKLYCCLILRNCLQQTTLISQQPSTWGQDPPTYLKDNHDVKSQIENVTFHHEGFFWRCWFNGIAEENDSSIWKFWYTNQPPSKNCMHAYLSPYPFTRGEHNSTSYDSAVIYRGFWAVLMLLGVVAVVTASFLIICAAPFASHVLYKAGGGGYIAAGILFSLVVMLYVIWVQAVADMEGYKNMKMRDCLEFTPSVLYGWSFFLAPAGIFFSLLAGLLFLVIGRHIQIHH
ncbi:transmembrane protein 182 isoform X1 [Herpailurus yagouaroundi]|uniref:transmembrane protein 182 isoform X1 n=1 Tax=Herpailurus yagouaroundi TaxID=1608482 RepID=UPI000F427EEF|nr:transmembrane protein 182 isoform X1 [Puma yagouaroundi]XP_040310055.1 transmembrane protein 182 isoform X1 [Puma yagouaroundi]XP_040310056.1 transmembrane protein 182 isoform X1 [Puma yagouaroundi]